MQTVRTFIGTPVTIPDEVKNMTEKLLAIPGSTGLRLMRVYYEKRDRYTAP
jgi:hypothetical protein